LSKFDSAIEEAQAQAVEAQAKVFELTNKIETAGSKMASGEDITIDIEHASLDDVHAYAPHLVSGGLSLEVVGRLLGHTSPETTKRYAHLADDPLRRATEMFGAKINESRDR
jgi:site-specific recombinase XerD